MRIQAGILAVLLAAALSGCGGGGGTDVAATACKPTLANPNVCVGGTGAAATTGGAATAAVPTAPAQLVFVSALPQNISMKGTGGAGRQETSTVTVKVLDSSGVAVPGVAVDFGLTTTVGGLALAPASATSRADGTASTVVAAGIVNTPVRVLATIRGSAISTLSDQLVISTGIPDQNSFTAVPTIYNIECANHDGTDFTSVTAFVADHFNNPVPDGTAVSFTTEAGAIDASCVTGQDKPTTLADGSTILQKGVPGQCTVRFICQNPHPRNVDGSVWDGRSTVLAYALGEESFRDDPLTFANGINRYDLGERTEDLREPFRYDRALVNTQAQSVNNGAGNAEVPGAPAITPVPGEPFIDTDGSGLWNAGDGLYNGVLQTANNGTKPTVHVRDAFVLVFSGSTAAIDALDPNPALASCVTGTPYQSAAQTFRIAIRDFNPTVYPGNNGIAGNILPAGTTIELTASNGTILSPTSFVVPNTNDPSFLAWTYPVTIQSDATQTGPGTTSNGVTNPGFVCNNPVSSGQLTLTVTTPLGLITTRSFPVTD